LPSYQKFLKCILAVQRRLQHSRMLSRRERPVVQDETAKYIEEQVCELERMARSQGLGTLTYRLGMVRREASRLRMVGVEASREPSNRDGRE